MHKYIIMGIKGSGKGTQAKLLAEELTLEHISVGDIFRWNVQHHTKIGAQVKRTIAAGHLVGDDLVEAVVRERLAVHDWNFGFIIDGFPRNARQAEFFLEGYDIDGVINLLLPDEEAARRVQARRICGRCGRDYNLVTHPPKVEGVCDVCGSTEFTRRPDDKRETVSARLEAYHRQTAPLLPYYAAQGRLHTVDGMADIDEVTRQLTTLLDRLQTGRAA